MTSIVLGLVVLFFLFRLFKQDNVQNQMADQSEGKPIEPVPAGTPMPYTPIPTMVPEKAE